MLFRTACDLKGTFQQWNIEGVEISYSFPELILSSGKNRMTIDYDGETGYYFVHTYMNNVPARVFELSNNVSLLHVVFSVLDSWQ